MKRKIRTPRRIVLGVLAMLALPAAALTGVFGHEAAKRVVSVLVVFVTLVIVFRLIGKRELGRLSPFELVTLMLIPEVLSNAVQSEGPLVDALVALSTLFLLVFVTSVLAHRFERFENLVEPRPTILISDGRLLEDALNEERIVADELFSEMRRQGIAHASEVRWAVLESSGNITFVPKHDHLPSASEDPKGP